MTTQTRELRLLGRYYNSHRHAMAIVAVINDWGEGRGDWAAYANGVDATLSMEDATDWVAWHGDKLSERDARYFFPDITLVYRP